MNHHHLAASALLTAASTAVICLAASGSALCAGGLAGLVLLTFQLETRIRDDASEAGIAPASPPTGRQAEAASTR